MPETGAREFINEHRQQAVAVLATFAGSLGMGAAIAANKANAAPAPQTFSGLYTSLTPGEVLTDLQNDLMPGQGMVLSGAELTPSTLTAQGNCEAGSVYSSWVDAPESLQETRCDGAPQPTVTRSADPTMQTRFQAELNKISARLINSIPGWSVDVKQNAQSVSAGTNSVTANLGCKPIIKKKDPYYLPIKSVTLHSDNKAALRYCPSHNSFSTSPVNLSSSKFAKAFDEYKNDPIRLEPFGGDHLTKYNLFFNCAEDLPFRVHPSIKFKYSKHNGVTATYDAMPVFAYCDEVGQSTAEISALVKRKGSSHFKHYGGTITHIDSLRNILVDQTSVVFPRSATKVHSMLPDTKLNCQAQSNKHAQVRLKLKWHFEGMDSQTFVHDKLGKTTGMPSHSESHYSSTQYVC